MYNLIVHKIIYIHVVKNKALINTVFDNIL